MLFLRFGDVVEFPALSVYTNEKRLWQVPFELCGNPADVRFSFLIRAIRQIQIDQSLIRKAGFNSAVT